MIGIKLKWLILCFCILFFIIILPLVLLTLYFKSKHIDNAFVDAIKKAPATEPVLNHILVKDSKLYILETVEAGKMDEIDLGDVSEDCILDYDHLKLEKARESFLTSILGEFGLKIFYRKSLVIKFIRLVNYMRFAKFEKNGAVLISVKDNKLEVTAKADDKSEKHEIQFRKSDEPLLICKYITSVFK
ncbi:hypothetical protein VCUG_01080 [Vavraia culicis subsp. floridensis]|uniref:Uncharacterized protein n=1 Tax=Vavraia culicis (isolate floridensis) TaxID=948595 RepID=L2GUY7_VAVCU|nr:uncharacterized protein VCUG_01080 [Vavraia culicis subsp. floridensis]ELA47429.2 hypothetical protein VCUG_01080 [Vavraia culicis subsp. floridensis]